MERYISEQAGKYIVDEVKKRAFVQTLTQEEYNALSNEEKNNGTIYIVSDGGAEGQIVSVPKKVSELENDVPFVEQSIIGNLADLDTDDKSNVVAAINEAASKGGGSFDYVTADDAESWFN